MGKEFGGELSGHGIWKWNDPIAWVLFIIMGAVLIAWLASSSSPLSTFPAFGNTCPAGSQVNICGLNSAFKVFSSTAILTGIMMLVVPLGLAMMGEYVFTLGDQEDTFGSRAAKETFYGARRAKHEKCSEQGFDFLWIVSRRQRDAGTGVLVPPSTFSV